MIPDLDSCEDSRFTAIFNVHTAHAWIMGELAVARSNHCCKENEAMMAKKLPDICTMMA